MKTNIVFLIMPLVFIIACNKSAEEELIKEHPVYAGVYNSDMTIVEFNPPVKPTLVLDTITNVYLGSDSLDIDLDGTFDLIIYQKMIDDSILISTYEFPNVQIKPKNGLEVLQVKEDYPVGHGTYYSVNWIDTLNFNNRIDHIGNSFESNKSTFMWSFHSPLFVCSYGCWYDLIYEQKYIGIRRKVNAEYKYGWIKVDVQSRIDFEFISSAIED